MRLRFASSAALFALSAVDVSPMAAQGRIIDEGTFAITKAGVAQTESFRVARVENGLIKATAQAVAGSRRVISALTIDSLGAPVSYEASVTEKGAKTVTVRAAGGGGRLIAKTNDQGGDESMREYPLVAGQSMVAESGLLHQLFFAAYGRRPGNVQVIDPRASRLTAGTLSALGLEPVDIGGKSVTGTHYSLVTGSLRRDFWIDAAGRLLRVEIASEQLVAAREELPR